ncbi:hypothetical protein [Oceanobacillus sojae]|uniref:hypothetical protein n=1 Tax=Oceanobacillus sojae TaxID=582851 RepID=UPI0009888D49|nr:hypothetical protein [Oceanobacillus sojae]
MAKLEGVKSLRVDSGENAKIEYDGAIYEKVADGSTDQIGDIVAGYIPIVADELSFFEVIGINDTTEHEGTGMFYDEDGDYNGMLRYDTFRKVDAQPSGLKKVDGPVVGGSVVFAEDFLDTTAGKAYEIIYVYDDNDFRFTDDKGDGHDNKLHWHSPTFYVKEEEPKLSPKPLFAKVNRPNNEPIVGDFIEFDLSDYRETYFTEGKSYEVVLDSVFDLSVVDDEGDNLDVFNHMRPIKAIFVKYTKPQAEQKAKIGDKVLIVDEDFIHSGYGNGDIVTVKHVDSDGDIHGVGTGFIAAEEFIVLTDAQSGDSEGEKETEEGYIPQEGDIVVITGNTNGSRNKIGDIGKVGEIDIHDARVFVAGRPTMANWTLFDEMRPATDEEKAKYLGGTEEVASAQSEETPSPYGEISVGDKVKVVVTDGEESEHGWGRVNNGDVGVVTDADFLGSIRVDFPNQKSWCAEESELIKVADNGDLLPGTFFRVNQGFLEGTIAEITGRRKHCDDCGGYGTAYDHTNDSGWLGTEQFDVLPKEEVKKHADVSTEEDVEAEELIPSDDIPIGTIVKVVQKGNGHYGETLRVTKNDGSGLFPYYTEELDGGFADVYDKEHLEIVEEPAQEEEKVEEGAIEVGDLVKVISSPNALPEGSHFIVKEVSDKGYVYSTFEDGTRSWGGFVYMHPDTQLELIAKAADVYA